MSGTAAPPAADADRAAVSALTFEAALAELEALVERMDSGTLELEASLAAYRRGMALLAHCQAQLTAAATQIEMMENGVPAGHPPEKDAP